MTEVINSPSLGVSAGVAGLGQLPTFSLPAAGGGTVNTWDYRSRRNLVVWLAGDSPTAIALQEAVDREIAFSEERAVLVTILQADLNAAESLKRAGLRGPVLADPDGRVHQLIAAGAPTLLVTDQNQVVYWRMPIEDGRPNFAEALSWLQYVGILDPSCGACQPAWPSELM
jgi:hypothetical protein